MSPRSAGRSAILPMTHTGPVRSSSAERVLDVAENLVAQRGFNAVSYADIAAQLGVSKPALHYHFAGKGDLGSALITRYASRFGAALTALDAAGTAPQTRLEGYAALYLAVLEEDRMCLCGMLAAEYRTLPTPMQDAVRDFFAANEAWLCTVLRDGRADGTLQFHGSPPDTAAMIIGCLEGAMLVARPFHDTARFKAAADNLLAGLTAA